MLPIIAGALGAIALVVALLFRRLSQLSRQLMVLRVERDSERILHQIGLHPGPTLLDLAGPASEPVRRKRHLTLYVGGLAAAAARLRHLGRHHPGATAAVGAATVAAVCTTAALLALGGGPPPPHRGHGAPPAITSPGPSGTASVSPEPTQTGTTNAPSPSARGPSAGSGTDEGGDAAMSSSGPIAQQSPAPPGSGPSGEPPPGSPTASSPGQPPGSSPPGTTAPPTTGPPQTSAPPPPTTGPGAPPLLCVDVRTLLELELCLGL